MKYKVIDDVLPRDLEPDLKEILKNFSLLIEDAVNFGTNLLKWDSEINREGDENLPPLMFLRNIIELGDAISILIENSSTDPSKLILRSLIENVFGLEYLLEKETKKRALSFIVWDTHQKLKLFEKHSSSTQRGKRFKKDLKDDRSTISAEKYFDIPELAIAKKNSEDLLKLPQYIEIEAAYQQTKNPKNWYSLYGGPANIEGLAKYLNLNASYEVLYRCYSENVHATNILTKKIVPNNNGSISIIQIRNPDDAQLVTLATLNFILMAYVTYFKSRLPERKKDFMDWYLEFRFNYQKLLNGNIINIIE